MENAVEEILDATNMRQRLIDVLDRAFKETHFYDAVVKEAEELIERHADDHGTLCSSLGAFVDAKMPAEARAAFEREVGSFVDEHVLPRL